MIISFVPTVNIYTYINSSYSDHVPCIDVTLGRGRQMIFFKAYNKSVLLVHEQIVLKSLACLVRYRPARLDLHESGTIG
jgi:hypothetical protein